MDVHGYISLGKSPAVPGDLFIAMLDYSMAKKKKKVVDLFPHFVRLCSTRFSINQHMQVSHAHIQRYAMTGYKWICPFCMYGKTIVDIFTASPVD